MTWISSAQDAQGATTGRLGIPEAPLGLDEVAGPATHTYADLRRAIPAGSVVVIDRDQDVGTATWTFNGTPANPVIVTGINRPTLSGDGLSQLRINGSNVILENLVFDGLAVRHNVDRVVFRDTEHTNIATGPEHGNYTAVFLNGTNTVLLRTHIHHNGSGDSDVHGVGGGSGVSGVWVLDCRSHHNRGGPRTSDSLLRWNPDQGEGVWHATEETELPG